jgi:hypothetical protein
MHLINANAASFRIANSIDYFTRGWCIAEFFVYLMTRFPIDPETIADIDLRVSETASPQRHKHADVIRSISQWNVLELLPSRMSDFMSLNELPTECSIWLPLDSDAVKIAIGFLMQSILDYDVESILNFTPGDGDTAQIVMPPSQRPGSILSVIHNVPLIKITKASGHVIESVLCYKWAPGLFVLAARDVAPTVVATLDEIAPYQSYDWLTNVRDQTNNDTAIVSAIKSWIQRWFQIVQVESVKEAYGLHNVQCTNLSDIAVCKKIINHSINECCHESRKQVHTLGFIVRSAYFELINECGSRTGDRTNPDRWLNGLKYMLDNGSRAEFNEFMSRQNEWGRPDSASDMS